MGHKKYLAKEWNAQTPTKAITIHDNCSLLEKLPILDKVISRDKMWYMPQQGLKPKTNDQIAHRHRIHIHYRYIPY